jgi:hypothetical protein
VATATAHKPLKSTLSSVFVSVAAYLYFIAFRSQVNLRRARLVTVITSGALYSSLTRHNDLGISQSDKPGMPQMEDRIFP